MDRNILIALGMLLSTTVVALMKGAITGNDVKEVLILVGGGVMGVANSGRAPSPKPAGPSVNVTPAAVAMAVVGALFLISGCATTGATCNPVMVRCNPADYPPLTAQLPRSPIPPPINQPIGDAP